MKAIKCDVCGKFFNNVSGATVAFRPNNKGGLWEGTNNGCSVLIDEDVFDLCDECALLSLRKYYGQSLKRKGVNV